MSDDAGLRAGLSVYQGQVTEPAVAQSLGLNFTSPEQALGFSLTAAWTVPLR